MAVIYRCDVCNKIVEKDKDIVKMKILLFNMNEGKPDNFADLAVSRIVCTECKNKILNLGNEKEETNNG
jgi:DNA-directed RNA polymerase subunit RPC12/RpoP